MRRKVGDAMGNEGRGWMCWVLLDLSRVGEARLYHFRYHYRSRCHYHYQVRLLQLPTDSENAQAISKNENAEDDKEV